MKDYVNLLFSVIEKIDLWEEKNHSEKKEILKYYIQDATNNDFFVEYYEKYIKFLSKNSFNNLSKDIITL